MRSTMIFVLTAVLYAFACTSAFAATPGAIGVRGPVPIAPVVLDTAGTNVTSAAWVTFVAAASMTYACSAIQIHNTGAQPIKMGKGAAASEVETGILFPVGVSVLLPVQLPKGVRLAVRSMGSTQSSGLLTFSCLQ